MQNHDTIEYRMEVADFYKQLLLQAVTPTDNLRNLYKVINKICVVLIYIYIYYKLLKG